MSFLGQQSNHFSIQDNDKHVEWAVRAKIVAVYQMLAVGFADRYTSVFWPYLILSFGPCKLSS